MKREEASVSVDNLWRLRSALPDQTDLLPGRLFLVIFLFPIYINIFFWILFISLTTKIRFSVVGNHVLDHAGRLLPLPDEVPTLISQSILSIDSLFLKQKCWQHRVTPTCRRIASTGSRNVSNILYNSTQLFWISVISFTYDHEQDDYFWWGVPIPISSKWNCCWNQSILQWRENRHISSTVSRTRFEIPRHRIVHLRQTSYLPIQILCVMANCIS